jgi:hypothetical protein
MVGIGFAHVRQKLTQCRVGNDGQIGRGKSMLRTLRKTFGGAMALMCLISTLALAQSQQGQPQAQGQQGQSQTMTCTKVDDKGNCIEARGTDDRLVIVMGEDMKTGEKMTCVTTAGVVHCTKIMVK